MTRSIGSRPRTSPRSGPKRNPLAPRYWWQVAQARVNTSRPRSTLPAIVAAGRYRAMASVASADGGANIARALARRGSSSTIIMRTRSGHSISLTAIFLAATASSSAWMRAGSRTNVAHRFAAHRGRPAIPEIDERHGDLRPLSARPARESRRSAPAPARRGAAPTGSGAGGGRRRAARGAGSRPRPPSASDPGLEIVSRALSSISAPAAPDGRPIVSSR